MTTPEVGRVLDEIRARFENRPNHIIHEVLAIVTTQAETIRRLEGDVARQTQFADQFRDLNLALEQHAEAAEQEVARLKADLPICTEHQREIGFCGTCLADHADRTAATRAAAVHDAEQRAEAAEGLLKTFLVSQPGHTCQGAPACPICSSPATGEPT